MSSPAMKQAERLLGARNIAFKLGEIKLCAEWLTGSNVNGGAGGNHVTGMFEVYVTAQGCLTVRDTTGMMPVFVAARECLGHGWSMRSCKREAYIEAKDAAIENCKSRCVSEFETLAYERDLEQHAGQGNGKRARDLPITIGSAASAAAAATSVSHPVSSTVGSGPMLPPNIYSQQHQYHHPQQQQQQQQQSLQPRLPAPALPAAMISGGHSQFTQPKSPVPSSADAVYGGAVTGPKSSSSSSSSSSVPGRGEGRTRSSAQQTAVSAAASGKGKR